MDAATASLIMAALRLARELADAGKLTDEQKSELDAIQSARKREMDRFENLMPGDDADAGDS